MTSDTQHHACCQHHGASSVSQNLDEMEFERGLWSAALNGEIDRVRKLLEDGKDVNGRDSAGYSPLHYAARNGKMEVCELLISNGACVNVQTRSGNVTPLHRAAYCGHLSIVRLLLRHHADVNLIDEDGKNALHKACERNQKNIVDILHNTDNSLQSVKDKRENLPEDYTTDLDIHKILT